MATFHVVGKPYFTILVSNSGVVQVIMNVLCAMFVFRQGFVHVPKDVSYEDDNIILSFIYQVPDVNPKRMFWIVTNGKYRIIGENVLNNIQNIIVTLGKTTSVANIATRGILIKEKPIATSHNSKFLVPIANSLFTNLVIFLTKMAFPFLMLLSLFL
jgi:hypothetical protein